MAVKDILLVLDSITENSKTSEAAAELAVRLDAHVTGLALAVEPVLPPLLVAPVPTDAIESVRNQVIQEARTAVTRFEEIARRSDARHDARIAEVMSGAIASAFVPQARLTDLIVVGQNDPENPEPNRTELIEAALFESGRPVLIIPANGTTTVALDRVMIAWDGSRTAARAVSAALPILAQAKAVDVVMVEKNKAAKTEPGADLALYLARHDLNVTLHSIEKKGSVAETLLDFGDKAGAGLVIMGGYGHSRMREFILGGATRNILEKARLPILMAH